MRKLCVITRHAATARILAQIFTGYEIEVRAHLKPDDIPNLPQIVAGVLPIPMIKQIIDSGREFYLFTVAVPAELRGKDLTENELEKLHWTLHKIEKVEIKEIKKVEG